MAGGGRKRVAVMMAVGWRDSPPDLTDGEHDGLTAMLDRAWADVRIDAASVPKIRREEAIAARISAYEWIRSDRQDFMSFCWVCLQLGIEDIAGARRKLLDGVEPPTGSISPRWEAEFASTDRNDRVYVKRKGKAKTSEASPLPPSSNPPACPAMDDRARIPYTLENLMSALDSLAANAPTEDEEEEEE